MTARASDKASIKLQTGMLVEIWVEFSNYGEWHRYIIIDDTIPHLDEDGKWRFTAEAPDPPWTFTFEKCVKPELIRVIDKIVAVPSYTVEDDEVVPSTTSPARSAQAD